jgi:DNA polymerase V
MTSIVPEAADLGTDVEVHAGFPNAAADAPQGTLSLDQLLIPSPHSTYLFRIRGHHWENVGVFDGDIAVVDRALTPRHGDAVIGWSENGELIMKRWREPGEVQPWGVIVATVHHMRHP